MSAERWSEAGGNRAVGKKWPEEQHGAAAGPRVGLGSHNARRATLNRPCIQRERTDRSVRQWRPSDAASCPTTCAACDRRVTSPAVELSCSYAATVCSHGDRVPAPTRHAPNETGPMPTQSCPAA